MMLCTCDEDRVLPRAVTLLRITSSFIHSNSNRRPPRPCAMCNTDNQQMRELNGLVQLRGQGRWALCGEGRPGEVQHTQGIRASPDGQSEASCGLSQQPHAARLPVGLRRHPAVVGSVRRHCHCVVFFLTFFLLLPQQSNEVLSHFLSLLEVCADSSYHNNQTKSFSLLSI